MSAAGEIIAVQDACAMPGGERITQAIYPLHAGRTGSAIYRAVVFAGGLALAVLAATGVFTYAQKLCRDQARPRKQRPHGEGHPAGRAG